MTAALTRAERLPELKTLLARRRKQTREEARAVMMQIAAFTGRTPQRVRLVRRELRAG